MSERFVLASASPRRAAILCSLGVEFRVVVSSADETLLPGEDPAHAVERLARLKAETVARTESLPVVGADTVVVIDGTILGKPASADEATAMLRRLSGHEHEVLTGLCVVRGASVRSAVERTSVRLATLSDDEIRDYVATGEPMDKAGAYHIDGRAARFVIGVSGSPSNVAGLPVRLLHTLAGELGIDLGGAR